MWAWLVNLWNAWRDPLDAFDDDDPFPDDALSCPDTEPTSPGALDD